MLTDIHHHLVFGVDDGAGDLCASLEMLRAAAAQGVRQIVCTAHDAPGLRPLDVSLYHQNLDTLRLAAQEAQLPVTLMSGSELLYTPEALTAIRAGSVLTLAGSRALLVEFFPDMPWQLLYRAAEDIALAGYRMVLAHAERYSCLAQPERLDELRHTLGVLIQLNADTVLNSAGLLGSRWTKTVMRAGLADIVASDAHSAQHRPCRLGKCYALLQRKYGPQEAERLCVASPSAIIKF